MAWIDKRGRLHSYRKPGRISEHTSAWIWHTLASDEPQAILGHVRFATRGRPEKNRNNHPHPCDGGFLVSNGTIPMHEQLAQMSRIELTTDCDTELVAALVERSRKRGKAARVSDAFGSVVFNDNLAVGAIWHKPARIYLIRNGKPLHVARPRGRGLVFASLADSLAHPAEPIDENRVHVLTTEAADKFTRQSRKELDWYRETY